MKVFSCCKELFFYPLQISDRGGGIPRSNIGLLFNYMYSTAPRPPSPDAVSMTPLVNCMKPSIYSFCLSIYELMSL